MRQLSQKFRLSNLISSRFSRHTPRRRGNQYAAPYRFNHWGLWNTGSPAFAGDDDQVWLRDLAAQCARGLHDLVPPRGRRRRECRVLAAPAVSRAIVRKENAHEHTGTAGALRHSLRNGFTAYGALSPATNSSCHRRQRISGPSECDRMPVILLLTCPTAKAANGARKCAPDDRLREAIHRAAYRKNGLLPPSLFELRRTGRRWRSSQ